MMAEAELMNHQLAAVEKLMASRVGALFMEEGTGRIRTAVELISRRRGRISKVVWFCPQALLEHVRQEVCGCAGALPVSWNFFSIESMSRNLQEISRALNLIDERTFMVVDESHFIKGVRAKRSRRLIRVSERSRYRLILSSTPVTQGIQDLYNQFRFLSARILGYRSYFAFASNHLEFSAGFPRRVIRAHNVEYLSAKIAPYTFQITRTECMELPEKIYRSRRFEMSAEQRSFYERVKREILEGMDFSGNHIFLLFVRLQQVLSGLYVSPECREQRIADGRLQALEGVLHSLGSAARTVIWVKYRFEASNVASLLPHEETAVLSGRISAGERRAVLDAFRVGPCRYLVVNLKLGKYRWELSGADAVVFYSNSFDYADRLRAENLCHRPGGRRVLFFDLVCRNSIDEKISSCLRKKERLIQDFHRSLGRTCSREEVVRWLDEL